MPLFQAQPLHRSVYSDDKLNDFECLDLQALTEREWDDYRATVVKDGNAALGHNAAEVRRRRRIETPGEPE